MLEAWLDEPVTSPRDLRTAFLAKLYLAQRRAPSVALRLVAGQRQALRDRQARLHEAAPAEPFLALVQRLRLAQVDAALAALDDVQALLQENMP